jgi:hypothetical protein
MEYFQTEIERYLLDRPRWVPASELVAHFGLPDDRPLRATGRNPGPLSRIAVFSSDGFKHIRHATVLDRIKCRNRLKRELLSRVRRIKWLGEGITNCLDYIHPRQTAEHHSGQMTFL